MKFRKKPVVIEAWHFNGENATSWPEWLHKYKTPSGRVCFFHDNKINIPTLEGNMDASEGDWIIKGIKGEIYPCKPDIFDATYEDWNDDE